MPRPRARKRRGKCWISAGRGFQCLFRGYKRLDKEYEKLQFDRESGESFQEKGTALSGVPLRVNLPIERHASKIYTRSMFEQFGEALYKTFAHEVDVLEHRKVYRVTHLDVVAREKWSKVVFIVNVHDDACFFHCECGTFEHSEMVCCHSLKVMIELRLKKIPENTLLRDGEGMLGIYCLITLCGTKKTSAANVGHF